MLHQNQQAVANKSSDPNIHRYVEQFFRNVAQIVEASFNFHILKKIEIQKDGKRK